MEFELGLSLAILFEQNNNSYLPTFLPTKLLLPNHDFQTIPKETYQTDKTYQIPCTKLTHTYQNVPTKQIIPTEP